MTFPELDLTLFYSGASVIFVALASIWAVRKVIKLLNRS